jgi:hypothetical protein
MAGAALAISLLWGPITPRTAASAEDNVGAVAGRGILEKASCLGCAMVIVGTGGLTFGGILLTAALYPEAVAACGFLCVRAVTA